jgi:alanine racemase
VEHRLAVSQQIEIDAAALQRNLKTFRRLVGSDVLIAAVVKSNAYGHGIEEVVRGAEHDTDWYAVHTAAEARSIRRLGVQSPILIMGFLPPGEIHDLDRNTHLFASTEEVIRWLGDYRRATGISLPVHLKIETGTRRQGVPPEQIPSMCSAAVEEGLEVVGVATHFANIEDTLEHEFARSQMRYFSQAVEVLRNELRHDPPFIHASCSAAALLFRETDFTLIRLGISMYGHWPSRETRLTWALDHQREQLDLAPVLRWRTMVGQLQDVAKGDTVGYGRTWKALRPSRIAVLPVGYADGYARVLGNRARVLVRGRPAPVVGRVCMNIMMVDVTDVPHVEVGDEVVLIGRQGDEEVTAEELADLSGTINYELLARLSPATPRHVVGTTTPPEAQPPEP